MSLCFDKASEHLLRNFKEKSEETGLYTTLSDAEIAANEGKTYQDATALRDPLMGLGFGEENPVPFKGAAQDAAVQDYNPSQPRDRNGRWTSGGGSGTIKGTAVLQGCPNWSQEICKAVWDTGNTISRSKCGRNSLYSGREAALQSGSRWIWRHENYKQPQDQVKG